MNDAAVLAFAATVCTEKQMQVLRLRSEGVGLRPMARQLGIHPRSAKDRLDSADLRLANAIREKAAHGDG